MKSVAKIFFATSIGYILGTIIGIYLDLYTSFAFILVSLSILVFSLIRKKLKNTNILTLSSLLFLFVFVGVFNFNYHLLKIDNQIEKNLENKKAKFIGVIKQELSETEYYKRYIVFVSSGEFEKRVIDLEQKIVVYAAEDSNLSYGDLVIFDGELERIKNFENDGNFNLSKYRIKDSIIYSIKASELSLIRSDEGNRVISLFLNIRNYFDENIKANISEPGSFLVSGMTIAGKGALSKDLKQSFIDSGLIHIVVLSGYNISLLALGVSFLSSFLRYRVRLFIIFLSIIFFILISGGEIPIIRASFMASIILLGKIWNRKLYSERVLLASAFFMTIVNPFLIPFDPSFVLSFLATFAVIFVSPVFKEFFRIRENNRVKNFLIELLSVQLFVAPYILFMMGQISIISPLTNILVLPLVPIVMVLGIFVGIFGGLTLFGFIGITASIISQLIILIAETGSSFSFSVINFTISNILLTIIYLLFTIAIYKIILINKNRIIIET